MSPNCLEYCYEVRDCVLSSAPDALTPSGIPSKPSSRQPKGRPSTGKEPVFDSDYEGAHPVHWSTAKRVTKQSERDAKGKGRARNTDEDVFAENEPDDVVQEVRKVTREYDRAVADFNNNHGNFMERFTRKNVCLCKHSFEGSTQI
jgi:hypothetical protein